MSGNSVLADTNIILYLLAGDKTLAEFLKGKNIYISFITELELLSWHGMETANKKEIEKLIRECKIINVNQTIKDIAINIRKQYKIKLPDAIILASSIYLDIPFITADKDFESVSEGNIILYVIYNCKTLRNIIKNCFE